MQGSGTDKGKGKKMGRIVTFGEIMLRLSPPDYVRFGRAASFNAVYGGAEANTAASLANFGEDVSFVTKAPSNPLGDAAVDFLRYWNIDTRHIVRGGERLGIYFLEKGASQRASKVVYDRKGSAIAEAMQQEFNWEDIFHGARWFHFTGITPALGDGPASICMDACSAAKAMGLTVSCDINFRKNLWSAGKAERVMSGLMQYVDVCMVNEEDAEKTFGIKTENTSVTKGRLDIKGYEAVASELVKRFGFQKVSITLRESLSASDNRWSAILYDRETLHQSKKYDVHIVDRVGAGDAFCGGLIYALLNKEHAKEALEFAVAASCLKHTIEGDFNQISVSEVEALMAGDGSGRVER
jgi:2-dehydro-3-deoxygluconokinase